MAMTKLRMAPVYMPTAEAGLFKYR